MRLIDVCIPKFGDEDTSNASPPPATRTVSGGFQLASGLFGPSEAEYNVDEDDADESDDDDDEDTSREELFFEADDGTTGVCFLC